MRPTDSSQGHGLFLAGDPGGAAALLPVIQEWKGKKTVFAYRHAADLFRSGGEDVRPLDERSAGDTEAAALLANTRPDFVCAATSVNGVDWERHFFVAARQLGIPSLAVLDYWSNYTVRFSLSRELDALPDLISVADERMLAEMIACGFPAERLRIAGQPVLDEVRRWHRALGEGRRAEFRAGLQVAEDTRLFLFVSQPLREMRRLAGADMDAQEDEVAGATRLARAIAQAPMASKRLLIKIHPREDADKYQSLLSAFPDLVRLSSSEMHRWEQCIAADIIYGIDSMLLEEAQIMGCPVHRLERGTPISLERGPVAPLSRTSNDLPASRRIVQILTHDLCSKVPASAGPV
jgi:hypothetical protein